MIFKDLHNIPVRWSVLYWILLSFAPHESCCCKLLSCKHRQDYSWHLLALKFSFCKSFFFYKNKSQNFMWNAVLIHKILSIKITCRITNASSIICHHLINQTSKWTFFPMVLKHICWHQRYGDFQDCRLWRKQSFKEHRLFCIKLDHYHLSSASKLSLSSVSSLHPPNSQSPFQNTSVGSQLRYIFFPISFPGKPN